jgi:hypothetical protein
MYIHTLGGTSHASWYEAEDTAKKAKKKKVQDRKKKWTLTPPKNFLLKII